MKCMAKGAAATRDLELMTSTHRRSTSVPGLDLAAGGWVLQGVGGWLDKLNSDVYLYIYFAARVTRGRSQRTLVA